MKEIRELVEIIVCSIVDDTENIEILEEETADGILYKISVSKDDVGKLVGKGGRIAIALRTIAKASGAKHGVKILTNVMNEPLEL